MAGFPTRISRSTLGPTREDGIPAKDETYCVSAWFFNLLFHQLAGLNQTNARAGGLIVGDALAAHEESWNPNGGVAPTFTHEATGHYRLVYPGTVKDEEDNDVAPNLTRARGFVQAAAAGVVTAQVTSGTQVDLYVWDAAGAALDADVWFEAF